MSPEWIGVLGGLVAVGLLVLVSGTFVYIPNPRVGVIERLWSPAGSVRQGLIALRGEAGFQPDVLRGGWHVLLPFVYRVHRVALVTVPQGHLGYVFARDGVDLAPTQTLADNTRASDFQDTRGFLLASGQKGPQRKVLREGTYAINLAQFVVITRERIYALTLDPLDVKTFTGMQETIQARNGFTPVVLRGADDAIGVVTVHDGPSLPAGEIIAPTVGDDPHQPATWHNNFQDPDRFLAAGGRRGRQLQVLVEGTWAINALFATVERVAKTVVDVGYVGVVVSYTGEAGSDLSGESYRHGELVARGRRGVWSEPLLPGKYAFNTFAGKVVIVPTTNFILKWKRTETGGHGFDDNLAEISLITRDAFEPHLPLSVVVHIDYRKAPLVVQRFGDVQRLVEQTLDPMVSAYFKNVGQTRTLVELIHDRAAIQAQASEEMRNRFLQYSLELQEVLLGTPNGGGTDAHIEELLGQLRARQVAEERIETYRQQERAAARERELREAEARARQQTALTESEIAIDVESNAGKADLARARQESERIRTLAEAESQKVRLMADGEAARVRALATAEAERA
ncbi:MAG TPA: SPFH domain-containing protein, partial [Myxococcota bacterium]|nr:SPFH domain-containing protein [Myxococcota bacterium]